MEEADLVFLKQLQDAVVVLFDHRILARNHLRHIHAQPFDADAMVSKVMTCLLEVLR